MLSSKRLQHLEGESAYEIWQIFSADFRVIVASFENNLSNSLHARSKKGSFSACGYFTEMLIKRKQEDEKLY